MKALTFEEPGIVKMNEVPMPAVGEDEVLIKVARVGVCGSDLAVLRSGGGIHKIQKGFISGHEFVGYRQDTGERVVADPCTKCGTCLMCRTGKSNICEHSIVIGGSGRNGAFAEYVAVPKKSLVPVKDDSIEDAKLAVSEPLAVALHGVNEVTFHGGPVAILGTGSIGFAVLHELKKRGVQDITMVDIQEARLELARKMGAKAATVLPENNYEVIFDAAGVTPTRLNAVNGVMRGGSVVFLGAAHKTLDFPVIKLILDNKSIHGSYGYTTTEFAAAVYDSFDVDTCWTQTVPFEDSEEALNEMLAGKADPGRVKLLFQMN